MRVFSVPLDVGAQPQPLDGHDALRWVGTGPISTTYVGSPATCRSWRPCSRASANEPPPLGAADPRRPGLAGHRRGGRPLRRPFGRRAGERRRHVPASQCRVDQGARAAESVQSLGHPVRDRRLRVRRARRPAAFAAVQADIAPSPTSPASNRSHRTDPQRGRRGRDSRGRNRHRRRHRARCGGGGDPGDSPTARRAPWAPRSTSPDPRASWPTSRRPSARSTGSCCSWRWAWCW